MRGWFDRAISGAEIRVMKTQSSKKPRNPRSQKPAVPASRGKKKERRMNVDEAARFVIEGLDGRDAAAGRTSGHHGKT